MPKPSLFNQVETPLVDNDIIIVEKGSGTSTAGDVGYAAARELKGFIKNDIDQLKVTDSSATNIDLSVIAHGEGLAANVSFWKSALYDSANSYRFSIEATLEIDFPFNSAEVLLAPYKQFQVNTTPGRVAREDLIEFRAEILSAQQDTGVGTTNTAIGVSRGFSTGNNGSFNPNTYGGGVTPLIKLAVPSGTPSGFLIKVVCEFIHQGFNVGTAPAQSVGIALGLEDVTGSSNTNSLVGKSTIRVREVLIDD